MFSFGLLAWQVLTGRNIDAIFDLLFDTLISWDQIYEWVYAQDLLPQRLGMDLLPERWRDIVAACLRADPRQRPSAEQVLKAMGCL